MAYAVACASPVFKSSMAGQKAGLAIRSVLPAPLPNCVSPMRYNVAGNGLLLNRPELGPLDVIVVGAMDMTEFQVIPKSLELFRREGYRVEIIVVPDEVTVIVFGPHKESITFKTRSIEEASIMFSTIYALW